MSVQPRFFVTPFWIENKTSVRKRPQAWRGEGGREGRSRDASVAFVSRFNRLSQPLTARFFFYLLLPTNFRFQFAIAVESRFSPIRGESGIELTGIRAGFESPERSRDLRSNRSFRGHSLTPLTRRTRSERCAPRNTGNGAIVGTDRSNYFIHSRRRRRRA